MTTWIGNETTGTPGTLRIGNEASDTSGHSYTLPYSPYSITGSGTYFAIATPPLTKDDVEATTKETLERVMADATEVIEEVLGRLQDDTHNNHVQVLALLKNIQDRFAIERQERLQEIARAEREARTKAKAEARDETKAEAAKWHPGDLAFEYFSKTPLKLIKPTTMVTDEQLPASSKLQRTVIDGWTAVDQKGNIKAVPEALLLRNNPRQEWGPGKYILAGIGLVSFYVGSFATLSYLLIY